MASNGTWLGSTATRNFFPRRVGKQPSRRFGSLNVLVDRGSAKSYAPDRERSPGACHALERDHVDRSKRSRSAQALSGLPRTQRTDRVAGRPAVTRRRHTDDRTRHPVQQRGFAQVGLGVDDDNPRAAALYLKLGFAETGVRYLDHWASSDRAGRRRDFADPCRFLVKHLQKALMSDPRVSPDNRETRGPFQAEM